MEAIPTSPQQKEPVRLKISPPALEIRELVGMRSFQPVLPATTLVLALELLALDTADNNTAVGTAAMFLNTTGPQNTALGTAALVFNNGGEGNTATGAFALYSNTEGDFNTANGDTHFISTILENGTPRSEIARCTVIVKAAGTRPLAIPPCYSISVGATTRRSVSDALSANTLASGTSHSAIGLSLPTEGTALIRPSVVERFLTTSPVYKIRL